MELRQRALEALRLSSPEEKVAAARALHAQATAALEASALRDTRALRALADMVVNRNN